MTHIFIQNIEFLQNHKYHYDASCKPKSSLSIELDFSHPYGFHRFPKATKMYHLNQNNHTDEPIFFSKSAPLFISKDFGYLWPNSMEITW